jgi:hypothetical protein
MLCSLCSRPVDLQRETLVFNVHVPTVVYHEVCHMALHRHLEAAYNATRCEHSEGNSHVD